MDSPDPAQIKPDRSLRTLNGDSDHPYIHIPLQSPSHAVALRARLLTYPVQHPSNVKKQA